MVKVKGGWDEGGMRENDEEQEKEELLNFKIQHILRRRERRTITRQRRKRGSGGDQ